MTEKFRKLFLLVMVLSIALPTAFFAQPVSPVAAQTGTTVNFTIMHTNDFHGQLEESTYEETKDGVTTTRTSNPGAARLATQIDIVRTEVTDANFLLFDAGDMMQGSLLSNIYKGEPVVSYYKYIGYDAVTFGNHEFDWGQTTLSERIAQFANTTADADPGGTHAVDVLAANVTTKTGDTCNWDTFTGAKAYELYDVGSAANVIQVGVIAVSSVETPTITKVESTAGLCFRDPYETIAHYYNDMVADGADVLVVLSHNGYADGGYGYGIPVYGDQTLAKKLNDANKSVDLIIGGHSHSKLSAATMVGNTAVVQAYYNGRYIGRADVAYNTGTGNATITWSFVNLYQQDVTTLPADSEVVDLIKVYSDDPEFTALKNDPVGYTDVELLRNYNGEGLMGNFIQDAIYGALNEDLEPTNDVDIVFNNAGGLRADICAEKCDDQIFEFAPSRLLTYGDLFSVLPFGNVAVVGDMQGWQIMELLNQSASLFKGAIQPAGIRYDFYRYAGAPAVTTYTTSAQTWAWGAFNVEVFDKTNGTWQPLDLTATYKVSTNDFLAPAGQDGYVSFKYMTNISYWGDMLDLVIAYVETNYPDAANAYSGALDLRIERDGDGDDVYETGEIIPLTILHHNDSHGRLLQVGTTPGYTNLATLIRREQSYNPTRTLLLTAGDNIQGDTMMYYFKAAGLGVTADGAPLPAEQQINPLIKAFNAMGYDAMTLGNHEFNFGSDVFKTLADAEFPILQANIAEETPDAYGLVTVGVEPYFEVEVDGINVGILGIGNHRIPNYELPSNIPGLTFSNPITTAQAEMAELTDNDVVIALTHIGFSAKAGSVEVDENVDTVFATQVPGIDAVIGGHSHSDPTGAFLEAPYKYLPTITEGADGEPVIINQANRYNTYLGEVILGLDPVTHEAVAYAGRAVKVDVATMPEDPTIKALVDPYNALLTAYRSTPLGDTLVPIDARQAYTKETNGANLQADAAVWKLRQEGIDVDFHLSGAMSNTLIADTATPASPYALKIDDMFKSMPYENSLLVLQLNGPQLKAILERGYRNYWYYKYTTDHGGYSYYTTCMLDTNKGNYIQYIVDDTTTFDSTVDHVEGLYIQGQKVDFTDAATYYNVSTVNYLAAGSCNFNDAGVTLWPLDQIENDTQYYVRDAVIEYVQAQEGTIAPKLEGRLMFFMDQILQIFGSFLKLGD